MAGRDLDTQDKKYVRTLLAASDALNHGVGRAERQRFGQWLTLRGRKESKLRLFIVTNFRLYVLKTSALRGRSVEKNLKIFDMSHLKLEELDTGGSAELSARFSREKPVNLSVICEPRMAEEFLHALMDVSTELMGGMPTRYHPKISVPPRFLHEYKPPVLSNQRALLWGYATACNYFEIRQLEHVFERLSESMQDTQRSVLKMGPLLKTMKDGKVVMLESKQIKAIASAIQYTPLIQRIRIQDIDLGDGGLKELNKVFRHNQALRRVMLDNIRISKSGMAEFAHDLTAKREFLEALVIRNNKVGDQGVRELCQALQRCLVEQLTVAYCNFGSKGYRSLVDLLSTEDYKSTLIHLDISGNKAGSTGSKCLSSWLLAAEKLETLELSDTDLDLDLVFEALAGNEELSLHRLQSVNFTGNKVPPSAAAGLGSILQNTESISLVYLRRMKFLKNAVEELFSKIFANRTGILFEIDLSECDLTDKGAQMFQQSVKRQETVDCVKTLIISNNNLGIQGTRTVAQCLLRMESLENLKIDANIPGGAFSGDPTAACEAVASLLEHNALPKLVYLSMCGDSSSNHYVKDSINPLLESLAINSTLTRLDINQNRMGDKGWEALVRAIGKNGNRSLQTIYCDDNKLSPRSLRLLERGIRTNNVIRTILPEDDIRRIKTLSRKKALELKPTFENLNHRLGLNKQRAAQEYQRRQKQLIREQQRRQYDDAPEYEEEVGEPDQDNYHDEHQRRGGRRRDRSHQREASNSRSNRRHRGQRSRRDRSVSREPGRDENRRTQSRTSNRRVSSRSSRRRPKADRERRDEGPNNPPTIPEDQRRSQSGSREPERSREHQQNGPPPDVNALSVAVPSLPWMVRMDPNRPAKALDATDSLPKQNHLPDFGVPLKDFEDSQKLPIPQYTEEIPVVLVRIFAYVFKHGGLEAPKIFQKAGYEKEIRQCKHALNKGRFKTANDLHSVAYLIRLWLQELPRRLLSSLKQNDMLEEVKDVNQVPSVLAELDEPNLSVFLWLLDMMAVTSRRAVVNEMTPERLAKIFAPHLFSRKIQSDVAVSFLKLAIDFRVSKMAAQSVVFPSHSRRQDFQPEAPREAMPTAIREKYLNKSQKSHAASSQQLNTEEKKSEEKLAEPRRSSNVDDDVPDMHRVQSADAASPKLEPKRRGSDMVPQRAHSQQVKRPSLPVTPQNPRKASDASSRSGSMSTPSRVHGKRPASGTSESSLNPVFEARAQLLNDADDLMTDRFEEAQYAAAAAAPGQRRHQHPSASSSVDYSLESHSRSRHASNASANGKGRRSVPMESKEDVLEEDHYGVRRHTSAKSPSVNMHAPLDPYGDEDIDEDDREDDDEEILLTPPSNFRNKLLDVERTDSGRSVGSGADTPIAYVDEDVSDDDDDLYADDEKLGPGDHQDGDVLGSGGGDSALSSIDDGGAAANLLMGGGGARMRRSPVSVHDPLEDGPGLSHAALAQRLLSHGRGPGGAGGGGGPGGGRGSVHAGAASRAFDSDDDGEDDDDDEEEELIPPGYAAERFSSLSSAHNHESAPDLLTGLGGGGSGPGTDARHDGTGGLDTDGLALDVGEPKTRPFRIPKPSSRSPSPPRRRGSGDRHRKVSDPRQRGTMPSGAAIADPDAPPPAVSSPAPRVLDAPPIAPAPLGSSRMLLDDDEPDEYFPPRRKSGEAGAGGGAALVPSLSIGSAQGSEDYEELDFGDGESMSGVSDIPSRAASSLAGDGAIDYGVESSRGSTPMLPPSTPPRTGSRLSSSAGGGGLTSSPPFSPPLSMRTQHVSASPPIAQRAQSHATAMSQTQRASVGRRGGGGGHDSSPSGSMTTTMRTKMNRTISLSIFTPPAPIMPTETGSPMTSPPLGSPINTQPSPRVRRSSSRKRPPNSGSGKSRMVPTKPRAPKPANLRSKSSKRSLIGQINEPEDADANDGESSSSPEPEVQRQSSSFDAPMMESDDEDDQKARNGGEGEGEIRGGGGNEGEGEDRQHQSVSPMLEPHYSPGSPGRKLPAVPKSPYDAAEPAPRYPKMWVLEGARSPPRRVTAEDDDEDFSNDEGDALSSLADDNML